MFDPENPIGRCPECGSTRIRTNETMLTSVAVDDWQLNDDGHLVMSESGDYEDFAEGCEPIDGAGYECCDCLSSFEHVFARGGPHSRKKIRRLNRRAKRLAAKKRHAHELIAALGKTLRCLSAIAATDAPQLATHVSSTELEHVRGVHARAHAALRRDLDEIDVEFATDTYRGTKSKPLAA